MDAKTWQMVQERLKEAVATATSAAEEKHAENMKRQRGCFLIDVKRRLFKAVMRLDREECEKVRVFLEECPAGLLLAGDMDLVDDALAAISHLEEEGGSDERTK